MGRKLSSREDEVIGLYCDGLCGKQIARKIGISTRTVDVHRGKAIIKLEAQNIVHAVNIYTQQRMKVLEDV